MELGLVNKFQRMEDTINKFLVALLSNKEGSSSNASDRNSIEVTFVGRQMF